MDEYLGEIEESEILYKTEDPEEQLQFIYTIITRLIERVIPEKPKVLTLKMAGRCLKTLGKIWNLSEYPPVNYFDETSDNCKEERLMDMDGFVDEYQYLHIQAVDMNLTDIRIIPKNFFWLLSADLSGNRLNNTLACPLTKLPNIVALRLNRNRFDDPYLPPMKHLQYLGLNSNQIESLHRIYHPNLETLDLNYNLIKQVDAEDCWKHTKLMQLELRGNKLSTTRGIEYSSLVTLYLAENQITQLEGLEILVNLQRLHLRDNPLSELSGFSESNVNLRYLNVRKCRIEIVEEFQMLGVLTGLRELILKGNVFNPERERRKKNEIEEEEDEENEEWGEEEESVQEEIEGEEESDQIRSKILSYLPGLIRIDKKLVTKEELRRLKEAAEEEG